MKERINNDFIYHEPVSQEQIDLYQEIRRKHRELALFLVEVVPKGREQNLALTKLEESMFWSNAGVARNT